MDKKEERKDKRKKKGKKGRKRKKRKKKRGVLGTFRHLHVPGKLFCQTFLQNGFNSSAESASPAQPQSQLPQQQRSPTKRNIDKTTSVMNR
jgi:hypothetical protein